MAVNAKPAGYHSLTPDIGAEYARKVLAVWARPGLGEGGGPFMAVRQAAASVAPIAPASPVAASTGGIALPGSTTAHIIPLAAGPNGVTSGRGLDAYRAAPTRLATSALLRRG